MSNDSPARRRFRASIQRPEPQINLAAAALYIAWEDQGAGDPEAALQLLDSIADAARLRIEGLSSPAGIMSGLNHYMFSELGFRGNTWNYNDPANSFLDRVLTTRIGLPITLSVIYMEVGWRLGLPLAGVALPGHFLVRYPAPTEEFFVDPFNQGRLWSREECMARVSAVYGAATPSLVERILRPPSKRAILARMLRNLKNSYIEGEDFAHALAAAERIVLLDPSDVQELRDRGLLRARLGQIPSALEDLDRYVRAMPHAPDLQQIREYGRMLAARTIVNN